MWRHIYCISACTCISGSSFPVGPPALWHRTDRNRDSRRSSLQRVHRTVWKWQDSQLIIGYIYSTKSTPWLLITRRNKKQWHQQSPYYPISPRISGFKTSRVKADRRRMQWLEVIIKLPWNILFLLCVLEWWLHGITKTHCALLTLCEINPPTTDAYL